MNTDNDVVFNLEPSEKFGRNSEGSFVTLKSGRILFMYSQFYGGDRDHSAARIVQIHSDDRGNTWHSTPQTVIENTGKNVMCVTLLRLKSGRLALFNLLRLGYHDTRPWVRFSEDESITWSEPKRIMDAPGYFVVNNDRVIQLSSGRLVMPVAFHRAKIDRTSEKDAQIDLKSIAMWYLSDDEGTTWRESRTWWALDCLSGNGLQEPGVVELSGGQLFSWARTDAGTQYCFISSNGGEHFTPPARSDLISPLSPCSIRRLPDTSALLAVYNDHSGCFFPFTPGIRTPLVSGISQDGGTTFPHRRVIENNPCGAFHYTAIHYVDSHALLAYCAGDKDVGWLNRLRIRRVSLKWFIDKS
jgi:sialidase-1